MRWFAATAVVSTVAGLDQHALVRGQPRQQLVRHTSWRQAVGGREAHAVLLHLIGAEQLRAQRRLVIERLGPARRLPPRRDLVRCVLIRRQGLKSFELPAFHADPTLYSPNRSASGCSCAKWHDTTVTMIGLLGATWRARPGAISGRAAR